MLMIEREEPGLQDLYPLAGREFELEFVRVRILPACGSGSCLQGVCEEPAVYMIAHLGANGEELDYSWACAGCAEEWIGNA